MTVGENPTRSGRPDVLDGPFTTPQLLRMDEALRLADRSTGLTFSVYVGDLDEPSRESAEKLHSQLAAPASSVLVAVSPNHPQLADWVGELEESEALRAMRSMGWRSAAPSTSGAALSRCCTGAAAPRPTAG